MSTNNFFKSDIFSLHNIVQSSMLVYPKEMIIATLRDLFSEDSYYRFAKDKWGFANTTDHTNLPPGADIPAGNPGSTALTGALLSTRLFIGENYRTDAIFYPAILIKSGGSKYVPISLNREQGGVEYEDIIYEDGYGNQTTISRPAYFFTAGIWEGSIIIDVMTRSLRSRDDLVQDIAMCFTDIKFNTLHDVGIVVKPISIGGVSETDDRNDKLFRQSLTLDIRTEWRRKIPVGNLIDAIFFTTEFQNLSSSTSVPAANLTVNSEINITDMLINM